MPTRPRKAPHAPTLELSTPMCTGARSARAGKGTVQTESGALRIATSARFDSLTHTKGIPMNNIVYIVGAVVIVIAILSFFGLR